LWRKWAHWRRRNPPRLKAVAQKEDITIDFKKHLATVQL
jgi:hypothetical protein